jgi:IS605 OrfB family transposase
MNLQGDINYRLLPAKVAQQTLMLVSQNVKSFFIGKNDGWKQSSNISKRNNQNFVAIPFDKLIQQIQYKGGLRSKLLSVANTVSRH